MPDLYQHEALPYDGYDGFIASCTDLAETALAQDRRLIVLAGSAKLDAFSDAMGGDSGEITFVATDEHGRNPSRITTMLHSFQAAGDGRACVGLNESILLGRSPAALDEIRLSEFLFNDPSIRDWPLSLICLYDRSVVDDPMMDAMRRSHAVIRGEAANEHYLPDLAATMFADPLPNAPAGSLRLDVRTGDLLTMRAFVRETAAASSVAPDRVDDLVMAANEIVTNSLRYGGGRASLAMWFADGAVVCEVADLGVISSPMLGRIAPPPSSTSGRGLWLANHLCDLVQIRSSSAGTVVRMHVDSV